MLKYKDVEKLNKYVNKNLKVLAKESLKSIREDFEIRFNHESTKIEGNTLTISEVKTLLVDKLSIGGKELRELYEVTNNQKAYKYIITILFQNYELSEEMIKDIHQIVMENILDGGLYRNYNVRITGASFPPQDWTQVRNNIKGFISDYKLKKIDYNPIELASYVHAEFVKIHPFPDGNGRTARLLLNFILMDNNYEPIIIEAKDRPIYYESLDNYATRGSLDDFYSLVLQKEYKVLEELKNEIDKVKKFTKN